MEMTMQMRGREWGGGKKREREGKGEVYKYIEWKPLKTGFSLLNFLLRGAAQNPPTLLRKMFKATMPFLQNQETTVTSVTWENLESH